LLRTDFEAVEGFGLMTRDWKIGFCGVAVVALALLAYAPFGSPPDAFFSLLKYNVARPYY
jgi:hypothetical protein